MSVCWLRERDGTLLAEVERPSVVKAPSWVDNGAGKAAVDIPLSDPSVATLRHASPVNGRKWKTVWDTDLELAWWPEGVVGVEPDGPPIWAGPVLSVEWRLGWLQVEAASQEWYVERAVPFASLYNYLGLADFDADPTLTQWLVDGTASTTTSGPQYEVGGRSALIEGTMAATAQVPLSDDGNYAHVSVAAYVPAGVTPFFDLAALVQLQTAPAGTTTWTAHQQWQIPFPSDWQHGRWYPLRVQVSQPADVEVRYLVTLVGGDAAIRYTKPKVTRPANIGATAGSDIGTVVSAIFQALIDTSGFTDRDNTMVGVDLAEPVRYFLVDRAQAGQMLADWTPYLHWWVEENVLYAAPQRGIERTSVSYSAATLKDWRLKVDASRACTEMIGQIDPVEGQGPPDEVVVETGAPNRLVGVVQIPGTIGPSDASALVEAHLEANEPVVTVTGQPALPSGPGDVSDYGVGDWFDVDISDSGETVSLQPVVAELSWHPFTHRVTPRLQLGGQRKPDLVALLSAQLAAAERERRRRAAVRSTGQRTTQQYVVPGGDLGDTVVSYTFPLPPGPKIVHAIHVAAGGDQTMTGVSIVDSGASAALSKVDVATATTSYATSAGSITVQGGIEGHTTDPTSRTLTVIVTQL